MEVKERRDFRVLDNENVMSIRNGKDINSCSK